MNACGLASATETDTDATVSDWDGTSKTAVALSEAAVTFPNYPDSLTQTFLHQCDDFCNIVIA